MKKKYINLDLYWLLSSETPRAAPSARHNANHVAGLLLAVEGLAAVEQALLRHVELVLGRLPGDEVVGVPWIGQQV